MVLLELRDLDAARDFVVQGLWLQRVFPPTHSANRTALEWALELAANGQPLPPIGFVADIGHVLLDSASEGPVRREIAGQPGLPGGLARIYEDIVLGKVFADRTIERAGDALRRYQGRERCRGVAFVVSQLRERAGFGGVLLSPAVIKSVLDAPAEEVRSRGWGSIDRGIQPLLIELYEALIGAIRRMAELLGPEDVFELEHGAALADLGQRVALRQVLQTVAKLETGLSKHKPKPQTNAREVATRVFDEDTYPVGGFASISTRGSIESLLHSQLAFMEPSAASRPDMFDIKFVRDELLYYSRDENQFLRQRRSFVFVMMPDLIRARFKDVDLPTQRIIMTLAVLVVAVHKLTEWLSTDALSFEFLFVADGETQPLAQEESLLKMLLREPITNGTVQINRVATIAAAGVALLDRSRRSFCHALNVGTTRRTSLTDGADVGFLMVNRSRPGLLLGRDSANVEDGDDWAAWQQMLERLIAAWV